MVIKGTKLAGVRVIEPQIFADARGHFLEIYQNQRYVTQSITDHFVQDNLSFSTKDVLRGLHYQLRQPQAKLVLVLDGRIFDVAVDIRLGSPSFGKWFGVVLSSEDYRQVFIPQGFAHGFCVLSETARVLYKCTDYHAPADERGLVWNDETLAIEWPVRAPVLSPKDAAYPSLKEISPDDLPLFHPAGSPPRTS